MEIPRRSFASDDRESSVSRRWINLLEKELPRRSFPQLRTRVDRESFACFYTRTYRVRRLIIWRLVRSWITGTPDRALKGRSLTSERVGFSVYILFGKERRRCFFGSRVVTPLSRNKNNAESNVIAAPIKQLPFGLV